MSKGGKTEKGKAKGHEKKGGSPHHVEKSGKRLGFEKRAQRAGEKGLAEVESVGEELTERLPED